MISAYPLTWPVGWPRKDPATRRANPFRASFAASRDELMAELKRFGARDVVLSTNIELKENGLPYAGQREPADPGIAVYFNHRKHPIVIACDTYRTTAGNIRACWATIDSLRRIERHGASDLLERAFQGFKALPAGSGEGEAPADTWWAVLGVDADADFDAVRAAYRRRAVEVHPDRGGSTGQMARVNVAWETFKQMRGIP